MFNSDTELLFPSRVIVNLRTLRGDVWCRLIDDVAQQDPNGSAFAAFVLMMVRLGGCVSCNADSFRAMRGCTQCARQTIRRFRGPDEELVELFQQTKLEVEKYMQRAV
jgi:hypothetical protein